MTAPDHSPPRPAPRRRRLLLAALGLGLLLPAAYLALNHYLVKQATRPEPQKPVDPKALREVVQRYLSDRRVAARPGDVAARPPWQKMGRRQPTSAPFGGRPPALIPVEEFVARDPLGSKLWRTFEDDTGDPVTDEVYRQVVKTARAAVDQDKQNSVAWFLLAMGLKEIQGEKLALEILDAVIKKEPGLWKAHLEKGILLSDMKRFDEALGALDHAEALKGTYEVYLNRGIALCFGQRFDESEWDLWKTVHIAPEDGNAYYDIAWIHAQRNEPAKAVEMLRYSSRDEALFEKRISRETLSGDSFFRPIRETPQFQAYLALLPSHDLRVERNWRTLSRFAKRRSLLERLLGIEPEAPPQ